MVTVSKASSTNIDDHYNAIANIVEGAPKKHFKERMLRCVNEGTAFHVEGSSCFLYFLQRNALIVDGVAFNGHQDPKVTLEMLYKIFEGTNVIEAVFYPHKDSPLRKCRSFIGRSRNTDRLKVNVKRILLKMAKTRG